MVNTPPNRTAPRPHPNPRPGDRSISEITLPHESWWAPGKCVEAEPRIEQYDDERVMALRGGDERRVPVTITRCIECGAQQIKEKADGRTG
jgi:hypothetical protein